jgi:hypothetical protein
MTTNVPSGRLSHTSWVQSTADVVDVIGPCVVETG